nr:unnamed protein product [Callosobruchus analis]
MQFSNSSAQEYAAPNHYDHAAVYKCKVRIKQINNNNYYQEIPVCKKAFLSLHGITPARLRRLQSSLCETLKSPIDRKGQHENRPNAVPEEIANLIKLHITSFKTRQPHYSLRENPNRRFWISLIALALGNIMHFQNAPTQEKQVYNARFVRHRITAERHDGLLKDKRQEAGMSKYIIE